MRVGHIALGPARRSRAATSPGRSGLPHPRRGRAPFELVLLAPVFRRSKTASRLRTFVPTSVCRRFTPVRRFSASTSRVALRSRSRTGRSRHAAPRCSCRRPPRRAGPIVPPARPVSVNDRSTHGPLLSGHPGEPRRLSNARQAKAASSTTVTSDSAIPMLIARCTRADRSSRRNVTPAPSHIRWIGTQIRLMTRNLSATSMPRLSG